MALARFDVKVPLAQEHLEVDDSFEDKLREILADNEVTVIVVGLPRGLEGQSTKQTEAVKAFVEQNVAGQSSAEIVFQDEALTSKMAEAHLEDKGVGYTKGQVDSLAAVFILQDYLNEHYRGE